MVRNVRGAARDSPFTRVSPDTGAVWVLNGCDWLRADSRDEALGLGSASCRRGRGRAHYSTSAKMTTQTVQGTKATVVLRSVVSWQEEPRLRVAHPESTGFYFKASWRSLF